jgi:hypothetical protein
MNAESCVEGLLIMYFGETLSTMDGATADGDIKNVNVLPCKYTFDHDICYKPENCLSHVLFMPSILNVQFDNCGENENKKICCY